MKKHFYSVKIVLFSLLAAAFIWSVFVEPGRLTEHKLIKETWPAGNLRIAFFSDLHAGSPHINKNYIKNLVSRINEFKPDIILIGGDLVINGVLGGAPISIEKLAPLIADLHAPLGKYVTLGNHDWWNDGVNIPRVLKQFDFIILENQSQLITLADKTQFWLIGIGDHYTDHADPVRAFAKVSDDHPKLVFMHDPGAILEMKETFFLAFAGHMHGGQIFVPGFGALITPGAAPKEWAKGWIESKLGPIFVSTGVGTSILPVRFNAPPEFVILDLKK